MDLLRLLRRQTKPPPKRMKGRSSLLRRSYAVLLLTSKIAWMCSDAPTLEALRNTVLVSILADPTSEEPTSKEPSSREQNSQELTSKEPSSDLPTSKEPSS